MNRLLIILLMGMTGLWSCGHSHPASKDNDSSVVIADAKAAESSGLKTADTTKRRAEMDSSRRSKKWDDYFVVNLNEDSIPDTLRLYSSTGSISSFDMVTVTLAGIGAKTFHAPEPWSRSDDWPVLLTKNAVQTDEFFIGRGKSQTVLMLSDETDGAGDRESFDIFDIEGNTIKMVLDQNQRHLHIQAPVDLTDLDGDGRLEFIYRQIFEYNGKPDTLDGHIGTYSPYFVYTVDNNCSLNKSLTIKYNEDHYVFAGFKYDESIEIFYPNDTTKRPSIWKK